MDDMTQTASPKRGKALTASNSAFEFPGMPKFEMPKFDFPKMEVPAAFREAAEKSVSQARDAYEKMKSAAEEATDALEGAYATASKGAADYSLKVIDSARINTNAALDFASEFVTVRSFAEAVEVSTAHARKQFEAVSTQTKELLALAQKVTAETTEPVTERFGKAFKTSA